VICDPDQEDPQQVSERILTISVIVPVYNGSATVGACLESLLGQTYPHGAYEVIVVENGSTDNTSHIVASYPVRLLHSELRGPAAARNLGLARSQADIIAFTDADCVADSCWLSELVRSYNDPAVGGAGGPILAAIQEPASMVEHFLAENPPVTNYISGAHEFLPHLGTGNASYRRGLLEQVGGFDPRLVTAEDVDLSWRLHLETGANLSFAENALIYHRPRVTRKGLARQFRQYGFGEILLDTLYGHCAGYPRSRACQLVRMLHQVAALPRYVASGLLRRLRLALGRATPYQAMVPWLALLREVSNLYGKCEGLVATRCMTDPRPALNMRTDVLIARLFQAKRE